MTRRMWIVAILALIGCSSAKHSNTGKGYVRNVWLRQCFDVTFEREDGMVFVYNFANHPAVYEGMHATIDYTYEPGALSMCPFTAGSVQRWITK